MNSYNELYSAIILAIPFWVVVIWLMNRQVKSRIASTKPESNDLAPIVAGMIDFINLLDSNTRSTLYTLHEAVYDNTPEEYIPALSDLVCSSDTNYRLLIIKMIRCLEVGISLDVKDTIVSYGKYICDESGMNLENFSKDISHSTKSEDPKIVISTALLLLIAIDSNISNDKIIKGKA